MSATVREGAWIWKNGFLREPEDFETIAYDVAASLHGQGVAHFEPFVSAGEYLEFKEVDQPRGATYADRFATFTGDQLLVDGEDVSVDLDRDGTADLALGNPDFRFLSFRSNVVLRWEYLLGSSMFIVWQHGRSDFTRQGRFDFSDGVGDLFRAPAENTFLVKMNYWFSL